MSYSGVAPFFISGWYVFDNFSAHSIHWRGNIYPTVEHAYQAAHFLETDPELAEEIRGCNSPLAASTLANENEALEDPHWVEKKLALMEELLRCKLAQHDSVKEMLIKSDNLLLLEANPNDAYWGGGEDGGGLNWMGRLWMKLRDELILNNEQLGTSNE